MMRLMGTLALLVLSAACGAAQGVAPAKVTDPHEITLINRSDGGALLFITATAGNELRVFNLNIPSGQVGQSRDFVRAPNPLEPLSVPVVDQPVGLTHDVSFLDGGAAGLIEDPGLYVFVRGAGSQQISIVFNDKVTGLSELARLVTPGVVTAMAARYFPSGAPDVDGGTLAAFVDGGNPIVSQLYFATYDGTRAQLWRQDLPAPGAPLLDGGLAPVFDSLPPYQTVTKADDGETIQALAVIPGTSELAVATHSPVAGKGKTLAFNLQTFATRPLRFPSPVRKLVSAPSTAVPGMGQRLFGLLDESSCGGDRGCRGIVAVDVTTGNISLDETGFPMLPIDPGVGPIQSFSLTPGLILPEAAGLPSYSCPFDAGCAAPFELAGVGTTAGASGGSIGSTGFNGGEIFYFDAQRLHLLGSFSTFADGGKAFAYTFPVLTFLDAYPDGGGVPPPTSKGGVQPILDGGQIVNPTPGAGLLTDTLFLQEGAIKTENIYVTYRGTIPGLVGVDVFGRDGGFFPTDGVVAKLDPLSPALQTVQPQDRFVFQDASGGECGDAPVMAVTLPPQPPGVSIDPGAIPSPKSCSFTRFSIRAAGSAPYVVVGTSSGYLGRVGSNQTFSGGSYFYRSPSVFPVTGGVAADAGSIPPPVTFQMGPQDPIITGPDFAYVIQAYSNFQHYYFWADPNVFTQGQGTPSGGLVPDDLITYILQDPSNGNIFERTYVSYPARNGLVECDDSLMLPLSLNNGGQRLFFYGG